MGTPDRQQALLQRTQAIVLALGRGPMGFAALQQMLDDVPAPTLSRLLKSIQAMGWIVHGDHGYELGEAARHFARQLLGQIDIGELLRPCLVALRDATGASAACYEWYDNKVVLRATAEAPESVHYTDIGKTVPEVTRHGFARALMAGLSNDQSWELARQSPKRESFTRQQWDDEMLAIRARSCAIECGSHKPHVTRIAFLVQQGRQPWLSIGVSTLGVDENVAEELCRVMTPIIKTFHENFKQNEHAEE